MPVSTVAY